MKTILPNDKEEPVERPSISHSLLWCKVNCGFPRIAPYQHVQVVNKVAKEWIQVSVVELMKNIGAFGFDHR